MDAGTHAEPNALDDDLAAAMSGFSNGRRIALLRQLWRPRILSDLRVPGEEGDRFISRQAIKEHLDHLVALGFVIASEAHGPRGPTMEYTMNHARVFAISEELRAIASLRPTKEFDLPTEVRSSDGDPPRFQRPCLILVHGLDEGREFDVAASPTRSAWLVGRKRTADITLDFDPYVSAENSVLEWSGTTHSIRDLPTSMNGTRLNFRPLPREEARALRSGDVIGVGRSLLLYLA